MTVPMCEGCPMDFPECCMAVEFKPCAIYDAEGDFTEMILRDTAVVNRQIMPGVSAGFDMDTGELVLLRVSGNHVTR